MTVEASEDQWATWLAHRRHGGDPEQLRRALEFLAPIRAEVITHAALTPGDTVLDVGCGDGLIAFAAAQEVGPSGSVIFSHVSTDLLDRCRQLAAELGIDKRCRFERAAASELSPIQDASVDAVTLRSVLIYEPDKAAAFAEFHRVLRPGGRLSLFEPINSFADPEAAGRLRGYDVGPLAGLAARVKALYEAIQPPASDPMLDFDERDLMRLAENSQFEQIHLKLRADIDRPEPTPWQAWLHSSGNPRIPTLAEAMEQTLTREETEQLSALLQPQVEQGTGHRRMAVAYLWACRRHRPAPPVPR